MANIFLDVVKGVEAGAEDVLKFLTGASQDVSKAGSAAPTVVAALGTLLGATATAVTSTATAVESGTVNIPLDAAALNSIKAVWPDVVSFAATLGIKI